MKDNKSFAVCSAKTWKSITEPGSVATILMTCPVDISDNAFLVRNIGSGQTNPRTSNSRSTCNVASLYASNGCVLVSFMVLLLSIYF